MQAVILAGGLGTRLRPVTEQIPKVLVPVAGRPFIDWLLESLPRGIFDEVLLLVGYLAEQVMEHCGDGRRYGLRVCYSVEEELLGTAGALANAAGKLAERFVLLNGDTYVPIDYGALLRRHEELGVVGTMAVARARDGAGNVELGENGLVERYAKGSGAEGLNGVDAGVIAFERRVLDYIPDRRPVGLEECVFGRLAEEGELGWFEVREFYDMGTPEGLKRAEEFLRGL